MNLGLGKAPARASLPTEPSQGGTLIRRSFKTALLAIGWLGTCVLARADTSNSAPPFAFESVPGAQWHFDGPLGSRIKANIENWLLPAPRSNPGMIEMFHLRDRKPVPNLVPWAGEFVGKYLLSAIPLARLPGNDQLRQTVESVVAQLIASQAEDGYLGPFPRADRLRGNWDLWGHYHCLEALLLWHDWQHDGASLLACRRSADLMCRTFLDGSFRVVDAGSPEMNMAVIHVLGHLYRLTSEPRYLQLIHQIEADWQKAGDYFRTALGNLEFYQTPRPRWESLHDLQGLVELHLISGDPRYRQAFEHHWRSIDRNDRRNTGGFSSGEQATGNPYAPTAIETCCTVAWMALSLNMLRLGGEESVVEDLELATYNAAAGAQHPSGRWWTYNTPMDGKREASAHTIVFQARAGTPELNCCSVNGPRSLAMLTDWTVMRSTNAWVVNTYGEWSFADRAKDPGLALTCEGDYLRDGVAHLRVREAGRGPTYVRLRIPSWSTKPSVVRNGRAINPIRPGEYATIEVHRGDVIDLRFHPVLRFIQGANEALNKVSIYRGPLLLAYDQNLNDFDEQNVPELDLGRLSEAKLVSTPRDAKPNSDYSQGLWCLIDVPARDGRSLRLCDFANAGAQGESYRSWLPASTSINR